MQGRRATQRDVAARAGVSTATVSYVLSRRQHGAGPTAETRARVLAAVRELDYRMDHTGRSLRRGRTDVIAVLYPSPSSPWLDELLDQMYAACDRRGYSVVVLPTRGTSTGHRVLPAPLRDHYVDGAIVTPDSLVDPAELVDLGRSGVSLVVFDDHLPATAIDVVRQNRAAGWAAGVGHVLGLGHRRVAYLHHPQDPQPRGPGPERDASTLETFRRVCCAHDVDPDPALVLPVADSRADSYAAVRRMLDGDARPTAVICETDRAAVQAVWAARDAGLRVPQDLCVLGLGNIPEGRVISPALTTVGMARLDFGPTIEQLLTRLREGPAGPRGREILAPWELIHRESV